MSISEIAASSSAVSSVSTAAVLAMATKTDGSADIPSRMAPAAASGAPMLSSPVLNARGMMLALMSLQGKAENANVNTGLEQCENQHNELERTLADRNEQMQKYYQKMGSKENCDTALAGISIALAVVMGGLSLATGGASLAGILGLVGAAASLSNGITSLPTVQEDMSATAQTVVPLVLGLTSLVCSIGAVGCSCSGHGLTALFGKNKGVDLAKNMTATLQKVKTCSQIGVGGTQFSASAATICSATLGMKAEERQAAAQSCDASREKIEGTLNTQTNTLDAIMKSYANIVNSTADMLAQNTKALNAALAVSA